MSLPVQTSPRMVIIWNKNLIFLFCFATILYSSSIGKMDNNAETKFQGMGSANFMEMQQRMQRELMSNPDTLRQVPL